MTTEQWSSVLLFSTGSLIAVESALLLFGMNYPKVSPWSTPFNIGFAFTDIAAGSWMIYSSIQLFHGNVLQRGSWFWILFPAMILSHIARDVEYLWMGHGAMFLQNSPLFLLNNIRIMFLTWSMIALL
jgi:hypothetical protein